VYRRTDMTKVSVAFRNFAKAPNTTTRCHTFFNKLVITVLQEITFASQLLNARN